MTIIYLHCTMYISVSCSVYKAQIASVMVEVPEPCAYAFFILSITVLGTYFHILFVSHVNNLDVVLS